METALFAVVALVVGVGATAFYFSNKLSSLRSELEAEQKALTDEVQRKAEKEADAIRKQALVDAKEKLLDDRTKFEDEVKEQRQELMRLEKRLLKKEENLEAKASNLESRESKLERKHKDADATQKRLEQKEAEIEDLKLEQEKVLERVSGMSREDARNQLLQQMEEEARRDGATIARKIVDEATENAETKAKYIISNAIQRCASEHVAETTVSVVDLPNDEMKGRIIGREGRNIRAIEAATGIDLIIDDTPECVILSGFDAVKRHIAGQVLQRLISDGRIHPARIEETVAKVQKEMGKSLRELGKNACAELSIHNVHEEIIHYMGRLNYRTSYTQNVLRHSVEVAFISGMIANELGANAKIARRAGLLHDIGKAMTHEIDGPHAVIGAEFCRKHGESEEVVHAIGAHHFDWEPQTLEAHIVLTADALSAARPGARMEILQSYIQRLEKLEEISMSFKGVERTYAIQAGREIRILVEPRSVNDDEMKLLAREIARKIETEVEYPGEIRVMCIRETRAMEVAK